MRVLKQDQSEFFSIYAFTSSWYFMLSLVEHENSFITSGPGYFAYYYMSREMRFPTMWYVRPAKAQTNLRIRAVLSEPLLVP